MLTNANHKTPDQRTGESRGPTEYPAPPHRKQYWNETIAAFSSALWLPAEQLRSRPRQNPLSRAKQDSLRRLAAQYREITHPRPPTTVTPRQPPRNGTKPDP